MSTLWIIYEERTMNDCDEILLSLIPLWNSNPRDRHAYVVYPLFSVINADLFFVHELN